MKNGRVKHRGLWMVGSGLLVAALFLISCSDDVNNPPFTPPKTYYSIEEALKEPEKVKTMFLVEIGDSLSPAIGKLTHPLPASLG
jgi:hypothetical protein